MDLGHGLSSDEPTVTAASRNALDHQLLVVMGLGLAIVWNSVRPVRDRRVAVAGRGRRAGLSS